MAIDIPGIKFREINDPELINWLGDNCPFLRHTILPIDLKIVVFDKIEKRVPLFSGNVVSVDFESFHYPLPYEFYIIKSGNAFSWITSFYETQRVGAKHVKRKGTIPEIFCEGDLLLYGSDVLAPLPSTDEWELLKYGEESEIPHNINVWKADIIPGLPFEKSIKPLEILQIDNEEINRAFLCRTGFVPYPMREEFLWSLFQHIEHKLFIYKWRLWGQLKNDTKRKALSILYLYFIGQFPLQEWVTLDKEKVSCKQERVYKKPRQPIQSFKVSRKELVLFIGISDTQVDNLFSGPGDKESIFKEDRKLSRLLQCTLIKGGFEFSLRQGCSISDLLQVLEERVISSY